jgi:hypothetical protein
MIVKAEKRNSGVRATEKDDDPSVIGVEELEVSEEVVNCQDHDDMLANETVATREALGNLTASESMGCKQATEFNTTMEKSSVNVMDLNVAYEALEQVRTANVAIEFGRQLSPKECILCLRERTIQPKANENETRFQRLLKAKHRLGTVGPCLTCGTPVCPMHRCPELKREHINMCVDCAAFFSVADLFVKMNTECRTISNEDARASRRRQMNLMLDVYDRSLLILIYSSRFIEEISTGLEHITKRNNRIGLGSSATNLASGIVGVAAAVTIFTPAGPPLLIASILFGGGATAASAGSEAVNYHSSANKMADTIISLHGILHSIADFAMPPGNEPASAPTGVDEVLGQASSPLQRKTNLRENSGTRRNWTRAAATAFRPLTAGALSAVSVVAEAHVMKETLNKIKAGNPCAKAEYLRTIGNEIDTFPTTSALAAACPELFGL